MIKAVRSVTLLFALVWSAAGSAQIDDEALAQGAEWYDRMHQALRGLNFDASLVYVRGHRIEPYRWHHGQTEEGEEVEVLFALNGPEYRALRHNDHVSYYHSMGAPYSLQSSVLRGPLPPGFFRPFEEIREAYNAVSVGGGRVIDRPAQHIRVVARDRQRYGYSLWLDKETGMLLRSATLSVEGDILEQVQLTHLQVHEAFPDHLDELTTVSRPPLVEDNSNSHSVQGSWQFGWLPSGFRLVRSNHHPMAVTGQPADYFLYSDGLASVSIYIVHRQDGAGPMQIEGADSLFATELGEYLVTVVGRLPLETVQRIGSSVRIK